MSSSITLTQLHTLQWQFQLTWRLAAEAQLFSLTDAACLWQPAPGSWTVHLSEDGNWRPDWSMPEPEPAPATTIGWLTWHLIWWWSGLIAAICGEEPSAHTAVFWPGSADAAILQLKSLSEQWTDILSQLQEADLERPLAYPWAEPRPLWIALAWANLELMKNIAEIGCIHRMFEATRSAE